MQDEEIEEKYGRYKLQPTEFDRDLFRQTVDLNSDELRLEYPLLFHKNGKYMKGKGPIPLAAYWFFVGRTENFISVDESQARRRFLALTDAIFQNFRFIVITLSKEDDPQVVFQTLNTGGEPLAAMDLVRNDVFLRAIRNGEDERHLLKKYWHIFEDAFWKAEHSQGRLTKPLMDFFLAHTLGAETGELVSLTELYVEYKKYAKNKPRYRLLKSWHKSRGMLLFIGSSSTPKRVVRYIGSPTDCRNSTFQLLIRLFC